MSGNYLFLMKFRFSYGIYNETLCSGRKPILQMCIVSRLYLDEIDEVNVYVLRLFIFRNNVFETGLYYLIGSYLFINIKITAGFEILYTL